MKAFHLLVLAAGSFVAGILLAPKSGRETREELKKKANEVYNKSSDTFETVKDEVKAGSENVKSIATEAADNVKESARRIKGEATRRADTIQGEVKHTTRFDK